MDEVLEEILLAVCQALVGKGCWAVALVGPPGVGKTAIATTINKSVGMGFGRILGGLIHDKSYLLGHDSVYLGASPGELMRIQVDNGQTDNVILIDEFDKIRSHELVAPLYHILDKEQSKNFRDGFCPEIPIDLSKNLYILSANSLDCISGALLDRIKVINVNGFNTETKIKICEKHLIPEAMSAVGLCVRPERAELKSHVKMLSPKISGVRTLSKSFSDVYGKLLLETIFGAKLIPKTDHTQTLLRGLRRKLTRENKTRRPRNQKIKGNFTGGSVT